MRAMGAGFDFLQHEAVETVCTDKQAENRIIEEVQSGYMRKDRGLRAAKVMVTIAGRAKHFKSNWHRFVNEQFGAADMIGGKLIHHPLNRRNNFRRQGISLLRGFYQERSGPCGRTHKAAGSDQSGYVQQRKGQKCLPRP